MAGISDTSKRRRAVLDDSYLLQQFLFEINVHLSWIDEHLTQINNAEIVTNLTTAKRLLNRHEVIFILFCLELVLIRSSNGYECDSPLRCTNNILIEQNYASIIVVGA